MTRLIALDTETTGLDPTIEEVFEIACVDVADGTEWRWTIEPSGHVVDVMHEKAAEVNRYHERTADPDWTWDAARVDGVDFARGTVDAVLGSIDQVLSGAHIIGAVPDFDTRFLTALYRRHYLDAPRWHYHLIDVEVLAVGSIMQRRGQLLKHRPADPHSIDQRIAALDEVLALPYDSDALAKACGIEPPSADERHTALGDARWVARWYRTLTGMESDR